MSDNNDNKQTATEEFFKTIVTIPIAVIRSHPTAPEDATCLGQIFTIEQVEITVGELCRHYARTRHLVLPDYENDEDLPESDAVRIHPDAETEQ